MEVAEHDTRSRRRSRWSSRARAPGGDEAGHGAPARTGLSARHPAARPGARLGVGGDPRGPAGPLCRHHRVELGLVTDGRWWALVWAPRGGSPRPPSSTRSPGRRPPSGSWCARSCPCSAADAGSAYRRASGWLPLLRAQPGQPGGDHRGARRPGPPGGGAARRRDRPRRHPRSGARRRAACGEDRARVYRGAVTVMMRIVFLLFAEERRLLPRQRAVRHGVLGGPAVRGAGAAGHRGQRGGAGAQLRRLAPAARLFNAVYRGRRPPAAEPARLRRFAVRPGGVPVAAAAPSTTARCCTCCAPCSTSRSARADAGAAHSQLPRPRRGADRLCLRGSAVVRGLPRRHGHGRADRQGGPGGGGPARRPWRRRGPA